MWQGLPSKTSLITPSQMANLQRPPSQGGISAGGISRESMTPEMIS